MKSVVMISISFNPEHFLNKHLFSVTLTLLKSTGQLFLWTVCQLRSVFFSLLIRVGLSTFSQKCHKSNSSCSQCLRCGGGRSHLCHYWLY